MQALITITQAAAILERSPLTVWKYVNKGILPATRYGGCGFLVKPADVIKLKQNLKPAGRPRKEAK